MINVTKVHRFTVAYIYIIYGYMVLRVRQQIRGKIIILNFTQFIHDDDIHPRHEQQVVVIHVYIIIILHEMTRGHAICYVRYILLYILFASRPTKNRVSALSRVNQWVESEVEFVFVCGYCRSAFVSR